MTPSTVSTNSLVSVEGEGRDHRAGSDEHEETRQHRDKGDEDEECEPASLWDGRPSGGTRSREETGDHRDSSWSAYGRPCALPVHLPKTPLIIARPVIAPSVHARGKRLGPFLLTSGSLTLVPHVTLGPCTLSAEPPTVPLDSDGEPSRQAPSP